MTNLYYDSEVAERRYILVNEKTGEVGADMDMEPARVVWANRRLFAQGKGWKWYPFTDLAEAA